jgi:exosome complex RNA-binding protein Csl4
LKNSNVEKDNIREIFDKIREKDIINAGDVVYGVVVSTTEKMAFIDVDCTDFNKVISPSSTGVLFVNQIVDGYLEKVSDLIRKGDLVKARVTEANKFGFRVTTGESNLGIIKGNCINCKHPLKLNLANNYTIKCENCQTQQTRKIAKM